MLCFCLPLFWKSKGYMQLLLFFCCCAPLKISRCNTSFALSRTRSVWDVGEFFPLALVHYASQVVFPSFFPSSGFNLFDTRATVINRYCWWPTKNANGFWLLELSCAPAPVEITHPLCRGGMRALTVNPCARAAALVFFLTHRRIFGHPSKILAYDFVHKFNQPKKMKITWPYINSTLNNPFIYVLRVDGKKKQRSLIFQVQVNLG